MTRTSNENKNKKYKNPKQTTKFFLKINKYTYKNKKKTNKQNKQNNKQQQKLN